MVSGRGALGAPWRFLVVLVFVASIIQFPATGPIGCQQPLLWNFSGYYGRKF